MRVAVLGTGTMGRLHAELLAGKPGVSELLVADVDAARARAAAQAAGARPVDPGAVVEQADAIVIATPPEAHGAALQAAVEAGIPALCEKPLSATLADTIRLVELVEARGATVQVGFQRRFDAGFAGARRLRLDGALGRIHLLRLAAHDPVQAPREGVDPPGLDAAPLFLGSSVHDYDVARWLTGQEVVEVHAEAAGRDEPSPAALSRIETAVVTLRLSAGALAVVDSTLLNPAGYDIRGEIVGSLDSAAIGLGPRTPMRRLDPPWRPGAAWGHYLERFRDAYDAELGTFLAVARGERASPCTARDGLEAARIAVAATWSYLERRRVRLEEVPGRLAVEAAAG